MPRATIPLIHSELYSLARTLRFRKHISDLAIVSSPACPGSNHLRDTVAFRANWPCQFSRGEIDYRQWPSANSRQPGPDAVQYLGATSRGVAPCPTRRAEISPA